jgi:soluble lytic murein transglycosylase-like protein
MNKLYGKAAVGAGKFMMKGAGKLIPGVGLLMAGVDAVGGWQNAGEISGKSGKDVTTGVKAKAATASVLSGLTMGLISDKQVYGMIEGIQKAVTGIFSGIGKMFGWIFKKMWGAMKFVFKAAMWAAFWPFLSIARVMGFDKQLQAMGLLDEKKDDAKGDPKTAAGKMGQKMGSRWKTIKGFFGGSDAVAAEIPKESKAEVKPTGQETAQNVAKKEDPTAKTNELLERQVQLQAANNEYAQTSAVTNEEMLKKEKDAEKNKPKEGSWQKQKEAKLMASHTKPAGPLGAPPAKKGFFSSVGSAIGDAVSQGWEATKEAGGKALTATGQAVKGAATAVWKAITGSFDAKYEPFKPTVQKAASANNLSEAYMRSMMYIESKGDPNAAHPKGAKGLYQFVPGTAKRYGIAGKEFDPELNINAAAKLAADNMQDLKRMGIPITDANLYMAHQQGAGGLKALLTSAQNGTDPTTIRFKNGQTLRENMDLNGGKGKNAAEFYNFWQNRYIKEAKAAGVLYEGGNAKMPESTAKPNQSAQAIPQNLEMQSSHGSSKSTAIASSHGGSATPAVASNASKSAATTANKSTAVKKNTAAVTAKGIVAAKASTEAVKASEQTNVNKQTAEKTSGTCKSLDELLRVNKEQVKVQYSLLDSSMKLEKKSEVLVQLPGETPEQARKRVAEEKDRSAVNNLTAKRGDTRNKADQVAMGYV